MPALLDDNKLSNTSLLDLLTQVKTEITDISGRMLMLLQHLCRDENETFLKIQLDVTGFKEFQNLKTALREYAEQGVANPIELAQKIFQGGLFSQYDQFAGHLKKTYKRVLHGLILDEKILFQCLDDIINFNHLILPLGTNKVDTFQGTLVAWTRELLTLPSHVAVPESLRIPFSEHRANLNNITTVATNLDKVLQEILGRLTKTLCIQLLNNAHQHNVIENSVPDAKTLAEVLAQHPLTAETYSQLLKRIANSSALLWSFEESYRNEYRDFLMVNTLHPRVHRLHYYNQGWNPSTKIVTGLCRGGVRFWSCLPHSTIQPIPLQIDKPTFQHMSWVDNQALYHYQLNQTGFDTVKNSGDHFYFSLCTVKEKFIVKEKPSSMSERYHRLVEMQFRDIAKYFELYPDNTSLELCLEDPLGKIPGHAVGFQCQQHGNKTYYYFCDFNSGVFFSENLLDLREWFKAYFLHKRYHECNYTKYEIFAIVPKTAKQQFNSSFAECVGALARMNELEVRGVYLRTAPAMLWLSKMQALARLSPEEVLDDRYRAQIKSLYAHSNSEDDKGNFLLQQQMLEIYRKIKHPDTPDHFIAWLANNNICEVLQSSMEDEHKGLLESIYTAFSFIEIFKKANPQYGALEIIILIQQARMFLKFPNLNKTDEGIAALRGFCDKTEKIRAEDVTNAEGHVKLQAFKDTLLQALDEKKDISELLNIAEEIDVGLTESLWMNRALRELWISSTVNGVIDNVTLENADTTDAEDVVDLGGSLLCSA